MTADPIPCFDPTCGCCRGWEGLDDQRQTEIVRLRAFILERATCYGCVDVGVHDDDCVWNELTAGGSDR